MKDACSKQDDIELQLTHDEIGVLGANKLKQMGYIATFSNITGAAISEKPDALGINSGGESFLLEVKVSRSDFLADRKKRHRNTEYAIGNYRAYLTPKGLLSPEEIPYGWQLWEVHGKTKPVIKVIKGPKYKRVPNGAFTFKETTYLHCTQEELEHFYDKAHYRGLVSMLATLLSRAGDEDIDIQRLATRNGKGFKR